MSFRPLANSKLTIELWQHSNRVVTIFGMCYHPVAIGIAMLRQVDAESPEWKWKSSLDSLELRAPLPSENASTDWNQ